MKKISLNNIRFQGIKNFECPECGFSFLFDSDEMHKFIIGYGNCPGAMNIDKIYGVAFECPKCYMKSYCHTTELYIKSVDNLIDMGKTEVDCNFNSLTRR